MKSKFEKMIGTTQKFYGVDGCKFKLGEFVFEAVENPQDGYRSSLKEIVPSKGKFQKTLLATVKITEISKKERGRDFIGYALTDRSGHVWLVIGTDEEDCYYPMFEFEYTPKRTKGKTYVW